LCQLLFTPSFLNCTNNKFCQRDTEQSSAIGPLNQDFKGSSKNPITALVKGIDKYQSVHFLKRYKELSCHLSRNLKEEKNNFTSNVPSVDEKNCKDTA